MIRISLHVLLVLGLVSASQGQAYDSGSSAGSSGGYGSSSGSGSSGYGSSTGSGGSGYGSSAGSGGSGYGSSAGSSSSGYGSSGNTGGGGYGSSAGGYGGPVAGYGGPAVGYGGGRGGSFGYGHFPGGYGGFGGNTQGARDQLEYLGQCVDNAGERQEQHEIDLNSLVKDANLNLDFKNNFEGTINPAVENKWKQQDGRLSILFQDIDNVRLLRDRVRRLRVESGKVKAALEFDVYPGRKDILNSIEMLKFADVDRRARIADAQGRADADAARIDTLKINIAINMRNLDIEETNIKTAIGSVNRQRAAFGTASLDPSGANGPASFVTEFAPPFDGTPQAYLNVMTGFRASLDSYYNGYSYPTIYCHLGTNIWNSRADTSAVDLSQGGWMVDLVHARSTAVYVDTTELMLVKLEEFVW